MGGSAAGHLADLQRARAAAFARRSAATPASGVPADVPRVDDAAGDGRAPVPAGPSVPGGPPVGARSDAHDPDTHQARRPSRTHTSRARASARPPPPAGRRAIATRRRRLPRLRRRRTTSRAMKRPTPRTTARTALRWPVPASRRRDATSGPGPRPAPCSRPARTGRTATWRRPAGRTSRGSTEPDATAGRTVPGCRRHRPPCPRPGRGPDPSPDRRPDRTPLRCPSSRSPRPRRATPSRPPIPPTHSSAPPRCRPARACSPQPYRRSRSWTGLHGPGARWARAGAARSTSPRPRRSSPRSRRPGSRRTARSRSTGSWANGPTTTWLRRARRSRRPRRRGSIRAGLLDGPDLPVPVPATDPNGQAFATVADEGWRAASGAAAERPDELTAAGLPKRRPRARLVPGSAGSAVLAAPASPTRSAESVRGRLASYQQGVRQGREIRLRRDPGTPAPSR